MTANPPLLDVAAGGPVVLLACNPPAVCCGRFRSIVQVVPGSPKDGAYAVSVNVAVPGVTVALPPTDTVGASPFKETEAVVGTTETGVSTLGAKAVSVNAAVSGTIADDKPTLTLGVKVVIETAAVTGVTNLGVATVGENPVSVNEAVAGSEVTGVATVGAKAFSVNAAVSGVTVEPVNVTPRTTGMLIRRSSAPRPAAYNVTISCCVKAL